MTRNCPSSPPFITSFLPDETALLPGLTAHTALTASTCLAIIDLDELEKIITVKQGLSPVFNLLSSEEKKILASFTYPKRRREWLGGRLAGKTCARMLTNPACTTSGFADLSILPSPNGSPVLTGSSITTDGQEPALSISHSHRYALAMAARARSCGVDIQRISDQTVRVADRFSDPDERQLLQDTLLDMNEAERLTLLWSAKEALKKSLLADQPIIFQGVSLLSVKRSLSISLRFRYPGAPSNRAYITAVTLGEYVLASTFSDPHHAGTA